jgi:type VI secretion system protein ImpB
MADSGQKFIKRNRPPRVQIEYKEPTSQRMVELPFVMGVMADLSGNASAVEKPVFTDRKFLDIDMDNFDKRLAAIEPAVNYRVDNKLGGGEGEGGKMGVNLKFQKMADFEPAAVAKQIPALAKLLEARQRLANLQQYMDGKSAAEAQLKALLNDPELMKLMSEKQKEDGSGPDDAGK